MLKHLTLMEESLTTTFLILLFFGAYQDIRKRQIPDYIVSGIFVLSFLRFVFLENQGTAERVTGIFIVSVPMLLITVAVPGAFGGGDIKFMAACGMYLGAETVFYSFFYAMVFGGFYSIYLILFKNKSRKTEFALGPFLVLGILLRLIFQGLFC